MKQKLILLSAVILLLVSCKDSTSRFAIDVSKNRVEVNIRRFDKDLILLDTLGDGLAKLYKAYPEFLPAYTSEIMEVPASDTTQVHRLFGQFLRDSVFSQVNNKVMAVFDDVKDIETDLSDAFTYIHHYFPKIKLPKIYFFVSGFNRQIMMTDKAMAMATDYYLGADYKHYQDFTYQYMVGNMRRECLSVDLVSAILFRHFNASAQGERLLDNMLFRAKVLYLLSVVMPDQSEDMIMGYSAEQMEWCLTNEKAVWATILDQQHLFSTDMLLIRKYLNDAPFTTPVSQKSPGRLGTWVGLQIMKAYMSENKSVTLQQLMQDNNYQQILEKSGYRP